MTDLKNILINNSKKFQQYANSFQRVFGVSLRKYWLNHMLGFDIVKFDNEVVKSGDRCMSDAVKEKYGNDGLKIVEELI